MSFDYILFCVTLLFCGVSSLVTNGPLSDFESLGNIYNIKGNFRFKEGLVYKMFCIKPKNYDVHWEVEPYGLKSSNFMRVVVWMEFKLDRDDDNITIGCYFKYKWTSKVYYIKKTFIWDEKIPESTSHTPSSLPDATNDTEQKCYQTNNIQKCAFFINKTNKQVQLQISTRENVKYTWVPVVFGVAGVAILLVLAFICYRFIRKRKQNEHTHAEPPIVYAEIQMERGGQRRDERKHRERENIDEPAVAYAELQWESNGQRRLKERGVKQSHYAKIFRFKSKKNDSKKKETKKKEPKLKNASENTRSRTEGTRIGTVERNNDLYSNPTDTRIGTVERINDLYLTAADTRIGTVERINDLYLTAADTRIGTVERINDLYLTAADTRIGAVERINDLYSTASDSQIGTVEQINDLYCTAADTQKDSKDQNLYLSVWR